MQKTDPFDILTIFKRGKVEGMLENLYTLPILG